MAISWSKAPAWPDPGGDEQRCRAIHIQLTDDVSAAGGSGAVAAAAGRSVPRGGSNAHRQVSCSLVGAGTTG